MTNDVLISVLKKRKAEIRERWAKDVMASSPKYSDRPIDEILASVDEMLAGLIAAASKGDYSRLFEFLNKIVALRSSTGFKLAEVQRVINIGTGIILDELRTECGMDEQDACFTAVKRLLDVMYWASMNLGDTFEDIRSKEFTAGTLIALGSAQQDLDEQEIMRKSLGLAMDLVKCSHGAISMHHLGGIVIMIPEKYRQCEELFTRLSGKVTRGRKTILVRKEGIAELVDWKPHDNDDRVTCAAGIPITTRGRVIGTLMLASAFERSLSPHEVIFLEAVASQIGLAADNARMIQQTKHREEFIRKEHDEILTILNELGAMVYVTDMRTYELLAANRPLLEAFGKDIVGKTCYEVLQTNQDAPCTFCTNARLVKDGKPTEPYVWKFHNTRLDRWYQCLDRAVEWPDGRLVRLEIALDISDLEQTRARLEEFASTMELYNDILVHDIGNYAGAAKAFVQLIADAPQAKKDQMTDSAIAQLTKVDILVDRMSKLMKAQTDARKNLVRCDLADVLDDAASTVIDGTDIELRKEYESRGYAVHLGEFASDIFVNLLSNAVKYGGKRPVTVRVSDAIIGERPAWKISVIDEGTGVSDEMKELLFTRYVRLPTMSQLKGQGLGLTIVRALTNIYHGEAGVEDRVPGDHTKGSIFYVTFPKAGPEGP